MRILSGTSPPPLRGLRVLTYNVHSCIGTDRQLDPHRIAEVIAKSRADIIALQELDVGRKRTGGIDQAQMIAALLKMKAHFHPALHVEEERYGDAILTAHPTRLMRAGPLPSVGETRGAIWLEVAVQGHQLNIINTHLGLRNRDRVRQVNALLGKDWIGSAEFRSNPSIVCGDLNSLRSTPAYRLLERQFRDAQLADGRTPRPTFPSRYPLLRIDHLFVSADFNVASVEVSADSVARQASDHLPLLVELDLAS